MIEITADVSKFPEVLLPPSKGENDRREIGSLSRETENRDCGEDELVANCIFSSYSLRGFPSLVYKPVNTSFERLIEDST